MLILAPPEVWRPLEVGICGNHTICGNGFGVCGCGDGCLLVLRVVWFARRAASCSWHSSWPLIKATINMLPTWEPSWLSISP
jgi:hypothetical protein